MDAKAQPPQGSPEDEEAPPSYLDSVSPSSSNNNKNSSTSISKQPIIPEKSSSSSFPSTAHHTRAIASQLQSLTTSLSAILTQQTLLQAAQESKVLEHFTESIQDYLSCFARSARQKGILMLVPQDSIPLSAHPCDFDTELDDLHATTRVYREWRRVPGCHSIDHAMAESVAATIRPRKELPKRPTPLVSRDSTAAAAAPTAPAANAKKSFWRKKSGYVSEPAKRVEEVEVKPEEDRVVMDVKADEIVFRTENAFGILETQRTWGLVLTIDIFLAGVGGL